MIERIIENWLINSTERVYQIPFCQILNAEGYKVCHLSSHSASEHGKDIIAVDSKGIPCAFQLKTGNINASKWREIHGEITELVEIPIEFPKKFKKYKHRAILVANGNISDDVRTKISSLNRGYRRRKLPKLEVISGKDLLDMFVKAQGIFLPKEPYEIRDFLKFYLSNGKNNISEREFSSFIDGVLVSDKKKRNKALQRSITAGLLFAKYALYPYEKVGNHISVLKGFILYESYLIAFAEKNRLKPSKWNTTKELCWYEIKNRLSEFKKEVLSKNNRFLEGDLTGDGGWIYKARTTIVLGWLAGYELLQHQEDKTYILDNKVFDLIVCNFPKYCYLWGESAVVYFIMIGLFLSKYGEKEKAAIVYKTVLYNIAHNNNLKSKRGLADPYYSPDDILADMFKLPNSKIEFESFIGTSYTAKVLVDCIARENRRDILEELWYPLTRIQYCEYIPEPLWHSFLWNTENGTEHHEPFKSLQSWKALKDEAFSKAKNIPEYIFNNKSFLILFLLTFPHRLRNDYIKILDQNIYVKDEESSITN